MAGDSLGRIAPGITDWKSSSAAGYCASGPWRRPMRSPKSSACCAKASPKKSVIYALQVLSVTVADGRIS